MELLNINDIATNQKELEIKIDKEYVAKTFADTTKKYDLSKYII